MRPGQLEAEAGVGGGGGSEEIQAAAESLLLREHDAPGLQDDPSPRIRRGAALALAAVAALATLAVVGGKALSHGKRHGEAGEEVQAFLGEKFIATGPCAAPGEDCMISRCCNTLGFVCYQKDEQFAGCRQHCAPGQINEKDPEGLRSEWDCEVLGGPNEDAVPLAELHTDEAAPPWQSQQSMACAPLAENCAPSRCCATQGFNCYKKVDGVAYCKKACTAGEHDPNDPPEFQDETWDCEFLGGPGPDAKPEGAAAAPAGCGPGAPSTAGCANSGCFVMRGDELLIVKHDYGTWDIPGGLFDDVEQPETTAKRETWEETGYKVKVHELMTVTANGFHIFRCELEEEEQVGEPDPGEISLVMWSTLAQLPQTGWRFQDELAFYQGQR